MSPSIDKYLPILYDIIKQTNKVFVTKCDNFFLNYNKQQRTHKLFIEYNGEEVAYICFTVQRQNSDGIRIYLNSFTNKLYQKRRYNLFLRTIITCFGCTIKNMAHIKGDLDLYSATADVIILHSILKYFQPRLLYSAPTKQTINSRADIILLQTMVNDAPFLKSLGALEVYVPLNAENNTFANLLLKRLLCGDSNTGGIIYPEHVIVMNN